MRFSAVRRTPFIKGAILINNIPPASQLSPSNEAKWHILQCKCNPEMRLEDSRFPLCDILAIVQEGFNTPLSQHVRQECNRLYLREFVSQADARAYRESYESVHSIGVGGRGDFCLLFVRRSPCFRDCSPCPAAGFELVWVRKFLRVID